MRTLIRIVALSALLLLANPLLADDFEAGMDAYSSADYETALAKWQPLAEAGDARACYGMGLLYGNGFGVMMDDAQALHWYGLAAKAGHGEAANKLGIMHQNGWGVPMNDTEAAKWYTLAAEQGVVEAQNALGNLYRAEFSDMHDIRKAYMWFAVAAKLGDINAATQRDELARGMETDEVIAAEGLVNVWFQGRQSLLANQPGE